MARVIGAVILLVCIGYASALHRIKLNKQFQNITSGREHIQSLGIKYGYNITALNDTINIGSSDDDPLLNYQNIQYYGYISIGASGDCYKAVFDTGSSDVWLPGSSCSSSACFNHKTYSCGGSSSCINRGGYYYLKYGIGEVDGALVTDTFCFGCNDDYFCVNNQEIVVASYITDRPFKYDPADGLVGMAFDSLAVVKPSTTPFTKLMRSSDCQQDVFAFWLNQDLGSSEGGEMTICGTDPYHYTGSIFWVPLNKLGYWQFTADYVKVNGATIDYSLQAIADTGTTMILGPQSLVVNLYRAIGVTYSYTYGFGVIDCKKARKLPTVTFIINGQKFPVDWQNYIIKDSGSGQCIVGIGGQTFDSTLWILGDVFLGRYYSVFDRANNRVGFAASAPVYKGTIGLKPAGFLTIASIIAAFLVKKY